jgi:hypothetical protein
MKERIYYIMYTSIVSNKTLLSQNQPMAYMRGFLNPNLIFTIY